MKTAILILFQLYFTTATAYLGNETPSSSCTYNLKEQTWPVDCFLLLELKKTPVTHPKYKDLDRWCQLFSSELMKTEPPAAFFSLKLSPICTATAQKALKHHRALKIIEGSFFE